MTIKPTNEKQAMKWIVRAAWRPPTIDTAFPWLLTIFGGRQSARTIHFIACFSFVGFIVIHVLQVILTGFFNNIRSMVTGWFVVKQEHEGAGHEA